MSVNSSPTLDNEYPNLKRFVRHYGLELRMIAIFLALGAALSLTSPYFLRVNNLLNLMDQSVVIGIAAIGQTLVILKAGIDLSTGSVLALSGIVFGLALGMMSIPLAILAALLVGVVTGFLNGLFVAKGGIAPFVVTLGMMAIARSQAYVLSGARSITNVPFSLNNLNTTMVLGIPISFWILIMLYVVMWVILTRTKAGRSLYAVGSNEEAARVAGIAVDRIKISAYVASGLFSALAAIFLSSRILSIDPIAGNGLELDVIAAVVIGGTSLFGGRGSIIGTLFGVFILVLIRNGLNLLGVDPYWQGTAIGTIIIAALLFDRFLSQRR